MHDHEYKQTSAYRCVYIKYVLIMILLFFHCMLMLYLLLKKIFRTDMLKKKLNESLDIKDIVSAQHILEKHKLYKRLPWLVLKLLTREIPHVNGKEDYWKFGPLPWDTSTLFQSRTFLKFLMHDTWLWYWRFVFSKHSS